LTVHFHLYLLQAGGIVRAARFVGSLRPMPGPPGIEDLLTNNACVLIFFFKSVIKWISTFLNIRRLVSSLQAGGIINVACAVGSLIPMPGDLMNFGVAKAGLMELTKGHAIQYAPDVRVNAICPGLFEGDEVSLVEYFSFARFS
jgi:NAD(P)-dependent dehydrogenase (short-subunit alcohol dehydrogenase family)